jgi:polysaccharide export outer membrane protein
MLKKLPLYVAVFSFLLVFFSSCKSYEQLKYVTDAGPDELLKEEGYEVTRATKTIQPQDYLYIKIYSLDEKVSSIFYNRNNTFNTDLKLISYQVNDEGSIDFPFAGKIHVENLTIEQAKDKLQTELSKYLKNISVTVRFVGNKITILGEVGAPGEYPYFDDKINVFQAIGFANGIADYGNKENILLIREKNNAITYNYMDLTKKNIAESEYYYLLPNDIIIVDPINAKYRNLRQRDLAFLSTVLSAVTTIVSLYFAFNRN